MGWDKLMSVWTFGWDFRVYGQETDGRNGQFGTKKTTRKTKKKYGKDKEEKTLLARPLERFAHAGAGQGNDRVVCCCLFFGSRNRAE